MNNKFNDHIKDSWTLFGFEYESTGLVAINSTQECKNNTSLDTVLARLGIEKTTPIKTSTIINHLDNSAKYLGIIDTELINDQGLSEECICKISECFLIDNFLILDLSFKDDLRKFIEEYLLSEGFSAVLKIKNLPDIHTFHKIAEILKYTSEIMSLCYDGDCLVIQSRKNK